MAEIDKNTSLTKMSLMFLGTDEEKKTRILELVRNLIPDEESEIVIHKENNVSAVIIMVSSIAIIELTLKQKVKSELDPKSQEQTLNCILLAKPPKDKHEERQHLKELERRAVRSEQKYKTNRHVKNAFYVKGGKGR